MGRLSKAPAAVVKRFSFLIIYRGRLKGYSPFEPLSLSGGLTLWGVEEGRQPLFIESPLPLIKGKGIKGIGLVKNRLIGGLTKWNFVFIVEALDKQISYCYK